MDDNRDLLLSIAWGTGIHLFQVKGIDSDDISGFNHVGYYKSDLEVVYAAWIGKGLIFSVDNRRDIKILCTGDFEPKFDAKFGNPSDMPANTKAVTNTQNIDDISYQTYIRDPSNKIKSSFNNTISTSENQNRAFILGFKRVYEGELVSWERMICKMIQELKWLNAFPLCLDLYTGKILYFDCLKMINNNKRKDKNIL